MIFSIFDKTTYGGQETADIFRNLNFYHQQAILGFDTLEYTMKGDFRPEQIAYELYGDSSLYWVLLLLNNMTDPYHDWLLPAEANIQTAIHRYQWVGGIDQIHHHVDEQGRWWYDVVEDPDNPRNWYNKENFTQPEEYRELLYFGVMIPVTVSEYEFNKNERKRTIQVLSSDDMADYVSTFLQLAEV